MCLYNAIVLYNMSNTLTQLQITVIDFKAVKLGFLQLRSSCSESVIGALVTVVFIHNQGPPVIDFSVVQPKTFVASFAK